MKSKYVLRPLGPLSAAASVFSLLFMLAGLAALGSVGYETFGPPSESVIVVSAQGGKDTAPTPEGIAAQAEADAALYESMRYGPDPYGYPAPAAPSTIDSHAIGLIAHLENDGLSLPTRLSLWAVALTAFGLALSALLWVWRAHANLLASGVPIRRTPAGAVFAYLVPGLNLVVPFEAMRELYNRSHGEPEELANAPVDDVTAWWTASIVGLLIFSALLFKLFVDRATNLIFLTPLWMEFVLVAFALSLLFGSALLFAALARKVTAAQADYLPTLAGNELVPAAPARPAVTLHRIAGG